MMVKVAKAVAALVVAGLCASAWAVTDKQRDEIAERIQPAGQVCVQGDASCGTAVAAAGGGEAKSGEEVYNTSCNACHGTGAAGAPKPGEKAAWAPRLEQGMDTLYANAINGIRGMPAKGLCMACSEEELKAAVDYMVEKSR